MNGEEQAMVEPIVLNASDNVAVLAQRADAGSDPLGLGHKLAKAVPAGHKLARHAIGAQEPIIKFGQVIGNATTAIAAGEHVHSHNCAFSEHDRNYRVGADLELARAAIPGMPAMTFEGYRRSDGRVGTRNFIALAATVNCSATVIAELIGIWLICCTPPARSVCRRSASR